MTFPMKKSQIFGTDAAITGISTGAEIDKKMNVRQDNITDK